MLKNMHDAEGGPNHALQRTPSAFCAGSPRAEEKYARGSLGKHLCRAAERGR